LRDQTCQDYELVVHERGSTDGTTEIFQQAAALDPRIKLHGRRTGDSNEVLLKALRGCRGEYVAICPSEGQLLPNALEIAIGQFANHPNAAGICTADFMIDGHGKSLDRVDIVNLLFSNYRPFLPAAF